MLVQKEVFIFIWVTCSTSYSFTLMEYFCCL